jgi:hypothetical protein
MADQETKADEQEDQDDTSGHRYTSATPDPDREANRHTNASDDAKEGEDDTEGHRFIT